MVQPRLKRAAALLAAAFVLAAGVTCSDSTTGPKGASRALVGLAPVFSRAAEDVYRNLVSFELEVTNVRVVLRRANDAIALDTSVVIAPGQDSVVLNLSVEVDGVQEVFEATIELRDGDQVLFSGTQTVTARVSAGGSPANQPVELEYTGPGATATALDVEPDTTISGLDNIVMRPVARDASNQIVTNLNLQWSLAAGSTPNVGSVNAGGVFDPSGSSGTAIISASLPTGISGSATVIIVSPPSAVVLISGGGQSGAVGSALTPIVVEVRAADGSPVPGHAVTFAVTAGGGSVAPASATTNASGRASVTLTLGTTLGQNSIQVTAAGLTPISVSATATPGAAARLAMVQQPSANAASGVALATQPSVRLQDAFGNSVATSNIAVTAALTTANGRTLQGTATQNTDASGLAQFTGLAISGPVGTTTLTFSSGSLTSATSSTIAVGAGAPGSIVGTSGTTVTDSAGANLGTEDRPRVLVRDASNNPLENMQVKFRRHGGVGASINAQPDTMVLVMTNASGVAGLTGRRLQTLVGLDTVLATVEGLSDTIRFVASVTHASATNLAFVQQPPNGAVGVVLSPATTVAVRDQFGNRVTTGPSATASVAVGMGLQDAQLSGTTSRAAVAGLATFDDLSLTPQGGYFLEAASSGLTGATSNPFTISAASASTRTWLNAAGGDWTTASNWSGGVVPGALDTAVIDLPGTYSVIVTTPVTVGKVVVGSASETAILGVIGPSGSLTLGDSLRVTPTGALSLGGGTGGVVLSGGSVLIQGVASWSGGTINGTSPIVVPPGGTFSISSGGIKTLSGRILSNEGTLLLQGTDADDLVLSDGAAIENGVEAELLIQGDVDILQGSGATGAVSNIFGFVRRLVGDNGTTTIAVPYLNSGSAITEIQAGTLAFSGATLTNTVNATIRGMGTLDVSGVTSFTNAGRIEPGLSPGALTITGNLPMQGSSRLQIELGGLTPGTEYDVLTVSGNASLSGTLEITNIGYNPQAGDSFTILNYASRSFTFASITGLDLGGGFTLVPTYGLTSLTLTVQGTGGTNVSWVNPSGGNWSTPSNWNTGVVPTVTDIVRIDLPGTYTVTLDVDATIAGLVVGGGTGAQGLSAGTERTLTVNGNSSIASNGTLHLTDAALMGTGTVTNQGSVVLSNSSVGATTTLNNQGSVIAHGFTAIGGPVVTTAGSTIRVQGESNGATLSFANAFTNNGLIELTSQNGLAAQLTVVSGTLINASGATIHSAFGEDGGARVLAAQLDNRGTLFVEQTLALNQSSAQHLNSGTIHVSGGTLAVIQTGTTPSFGNTGTIDIGTGRTFAVSDGVVTNASGGVIRGTGTLDVSEGATFSNGGTIAPNGPGAVGVLVVAGTYTHSATGTLNIELAGTSQYDILTISGAALLGGTLDVSQMDGFVPAAGNSFTVLNYQSHTGAFDNLNLPALSAGLEWIADFGASGLTLTVQAASGASVSWINPSGGLWSLGSNWSTGVLPTVSDVVGFGLAVGNTATLDLNATIAGLELGTGAGVQGLSAAGRVFTINGPVNVHPNGSLALTASTLNGTGSVTNLGSIGLLSSTVTNVVNNQAFLLAAGNANVNNVLTTSPTSTFLVQEQTAGAAANVTVLQGFTNSGLLEIRSATGDGTHLTVTNGTLTNAAGAFLRATGLAGGPRTLNAQLANQGTLVAERPLTLTRSSDAIHTNSGTIDLTAANLTLAQTGASSFTNTGAVTIGSGHEFTVNSGTFTHQAGATLSGDGTLTLNTVPAANFLTVFSLGALNVNSSALNLGSGVTLSTAGMAVNLFSTSVTGPGTIINAEGRTLTLTGTNVTATSALNNQGTLLVNGGSQVNGPLTAPAGSLIRVQPDGSTGFASLVVPVSGFVNDGAVELTSTVNGFSQFMANSGGTFTNGAGGTITALAGSGGQRLLGQVNNLGTITVHRGENAGVITVSGSLTTSGTINIELGGTTPGSSYSQITLNNVLTAGGTLNVSLVNGFAPAEGNAFVILSYASLSGDFATINLPTLGAGLAWDVDVGASALTLTVNATSGGSVTWVNASGGNWSTPSNWSTGVVPGPTDIVGIDLAGTYTVTLDVNTTIAELNLGGATGTQTLTGSGRVLTVNGPTSIAESGALILTSSSMNGTGTITNSGSVVLRGTVDLAGAFQNNGGVLRVEVHETAGPAHAVFSSGVANSGTIDMTTSGGHGPTQITVSSGSLTNATGGTIVTSGGGARTITAQLDNQGLLSIGTGLTLDRPDAQHTNSGSITVSDGLTVNMTTGSFTNTASGTVTLNWIWSVTGGTLDIDEGTVSTPSDMFLSVNSATLSFTPNSVTVPLTIVNTSVSGGINVGTSQTVTLQNSNLLAGTAINVQSGGTLVVRGATTFNGPVTQNGILRILALGAFDAALTVANGFTNNGLIELTGLQSIAPAELTVANGTLVNGPDGTISSLHGTFGGARTLTAQLDNQGSLIVEGLSLAKADAAHVNTGTIDLPGRLTVTQTGTAPSFTNNGNIQLSGGTGLLLAVDGGTFTNGGGDPPGVITGAGTIQLVGTTLTNHGVMEPSGVMNIDGNYTQGPGGTLNSVMSSLSQFGQLSVSGIANLAGTLTVFVNDFVPDVHGQNLVLLTSSSPLVGALTPGPLTFTGGHFTVTQNSTQIFVTTVLDGFPTAFWANASDGNWNTASNWNTGVVPAATDIVGIQLPGTYTVTLDASPTIAGLVLGSTSGTQTLSGTSRTLTVNGPTAITSAGSLQLTSSTLNGTGSVTNLGSMVLLATGTGASTTIDNQGSLVVRNTSTIGGLLVTGTTSAIIVEGSSAGAGVMNVTNSFTNQGTIDLTTANGNPATLSAGGTLINAPTGTIRSLPGGGPRTLAAQLDNRGTIQSIFPLTIDRASAQHLNSGLVELGSLGDLVLSQTGTTPTFTNNGVIRIPANRTFVVNGGAFANGDPAGVVEGGAGGSIQFNGATISLDGSVTPTGIFNWNGAYSPSASAALNVEIRGTAPGAGGGTYDRLATPNNTATLNGTLNVTLNGFTPANGQFFVVVSATAGSVTGTFSQTNLPDLSGLGLAWEIDYNATDVVLRVVIP